MRALLVFLIASVLAISSGCPMGWMEFQEKCYYFAQTQETWTDASSFCQSFHSMLAEPKSSAEIGFLSGEIQALGGYLNYWVGITDLIVENTWVYDSSITPIQGNNWGPNEPNGHRGENCVVLSGFYHGKYADVECHTTRKFICERNSGFDSTLVIG
ncbi:C-type lectin domain family 17, member A-like [Crassostrea virginica]